eukprot:225844-Prorocentrum_minimum.AAC.2
MVAYGICVLCMASRLSDSPAAPPSAPGYAIHLWEAIIVGVFGYYRGALVSGFWDDEVYGAKPGMALMIQLVNVYNPLSCPYISKGMGVVCLTQGSSGKDGALGCPCRFTAGSSLMRLTFCMVCGLLTTAVPYPVQISETGDDIQKTRTKAKASLLRGSP